MYLPPYEDEKYVSDRHNELVSSGSAKLKKHVAETKRKVHTNKLRKAHKQEEELRFTTDWQEICRVVSNETNYKELQEISASVGLPIINTEKDKPMTKRELCAQLAEHMALTLQEKECKNSQNLALEDLSEIPNSCLVSDPDGYCYDASEIVDANGVSRLLPQRAPFINRSPYNREELDEMIFIKARQQRDQCLRDKANPSIHDKRLRRKKQTVMNTQIQVLRQVLLELPDFKYVDQFLNMNNSDLSRIIREINKQKVVKATEFNVNSDRNPSVNVGELISSLRNNNANIDIISVALNDAYEALPKPRTGARTSIPEDMTRAANEAREASTVSRPPSTSRPRTFNLNNTSTVSRHPRTFNLDTSRPRTFNLNDPAFLSRVEGLSDSSSFTFTRNTPGNNTSYISRITDLRNYLRDNFSTPLQEGHYRVFEYQGVKYSILKTNHTTTDPTRVYGEHSPAPGDYSKQDFMDMNMWVKLQNTAAKINVPQNTTVPLQGSDDVINKPSGLYTFVDLFPPGDYVIYEPHYQTRKMIATNIDGQVTKWGPVYAHINKGVVNSAMFGFMRLGYVDEYDVAYSIPDTRQIATGVELTPGVHDIREIIEHTTD